MTHLLRTTETAATRWMTPAELALQLQVHDSTVRRWISTGELRAYHHGPRRLRIAQVDAEAFQLTHTGPVEPRLLRAEVAEQRVASG